MRERVAAVVLAAGGSSRLGCPKQKEHQVLYHADFHIEYPASMSQGDFFSMWAREADAALGAKKAGVVVDLWKCVGTQRVMAIVNVDGPDTRPPLGSGYERVAPVMPRRPVVPVGAPGELRLDAKKSDVIPEYPY
jgi:muconolactone delta-isomerase